jgi:hypothetical protein
MHEAKERLQGGGKIFHFFFSLTKRYERGTAVVE